MEVRNLKKINSWEQSAKRAFISAFVFVVFCLIFTYVVMIFTGGQTFIGKAHNYETINGISYNAVRIVCGVLAGLISAFMMRCNCAKFLLLYIPLNIIFYLILTFLTITSVFGNNFDFLGYAIFPVPVGIVCGMAVAVVLGIINQHKYKYVSQNTTSHIAFHDCRCSKMYYKHNKLILDMEWLEILPSHPQNPYDKAYSTDKGQVVFYNPRILNCTLYQAGEIETKINSFKELNLQNFEILEYDETLENGLYCAEMYFFVNKGGVGISLKLAFDKSCVCFDNFTKISWFEERKLQVKSCKKVLSFGEVLWDVYPDKEFIGGAPLNFASHFAKCGGKSFMLSAVGEDSLGQKTLETVQNLGVNTKYINRSEKQTGKCEVWLDDKGVPSYNLLCDVAYDDIKYESFGDEKFDALYFGTLALRSQNNLDTLCKVIENNTFEEIFVDLNIRPPFFSQNTIDFALKSASIVKISDEELNTVMQNSVQSFDSDLIKCAQALSDKYKNLGIVLITKGENGAFAYNCKTKESFECKAHKVKVASTVGAGDSFSAAFLSKFMSGNDIQTCLEFASKISAFVVSKHEAIPEYDKALLL